MSTLLRDAIAQKMRKGMTIDNVRDTYGIDLRPRRDQDMIEDCVRQMRDGSTVTDVSRDTGVSRSTLTRWRKRSDMQSRYLMRDEHNRETVVAMWREGRTTSEIAQAIGVPATSVSMWASRHRDLCPARTRGRKPKEHV